LTLLYAAVPRLSTCSGDHFIPGHAYVAIRVDDTNDNYYFIETTMIGHATFKQAVAEGNSSGPTRSPMSTAEADYGWSMWPRPGQRHRAIPWH